MKCLKLFAVVVLVGAAALAVAGPDPAAAETVLCTENASPCPYGKADGSGTEIKMSLVSGTRSKLTTPYNNIECRKSSVTSKVTSTGEKIGAGIESLAFEECNCEVKVLAKGTLELQRIASTANATITSTGTEVTTACSTVFGNVHCIYKTEATDLGTLEGGNPAKVKINGANIPRLATDARCNEGEGAKWDVEYEVTSPKPLYIEPERGPKEAVLCTATSTPCPAEKTDGEIKLSSTGISKVTTTFKTIECSKYSLTAKVTGTTEKAIATVESLSFESCNCEVKVLKKGTLELSHIKSTDNATVKSTGTEVTTECSTIFGNVHCIYVTEATDLGTLQGGNPAKLAITVTLPRASTSALCNEEAVWHAEYEATSPKPLYIEPEAAPIGFCTETTTPCPAEKTDGEMKMSGIGTSKLTTTFKNIECSKYSLTAKGTSASGTVVSNVEALNFESCNCEVKVLKKGTLELQPIKSTDNATVKSTGTEVTTECSTIFGNVHCIYVTEATDFGTLQGGNPAKLTITAELPRTSTSALCNEEAVWHAEYEATTPKPLYVT